MKESLESFFDENTKWKKQYIFLRKLILNTGLKEELKWGKPCYTFKSKNIVLIHGFKNYCALLFHKGALLNDPAEILVRQTKNVQAARQLRFVNLKEIQELEGTITEYIYEAIEVEKAGLEVKMKRTSDFEMPTEFRVALEDDVKLRDAFKSLTPGRQRAYLLYFSQAKQSETRKRRIEKYKPEIVKGKGLND